MPAIRFLLLLMPLLLVCGPGQAIVLLPGFGQTTLENQFEYLEDPAGELAIGDLDAVAAARWQTSAAPTLNPGFTSSVYWLRFEIGNGVAEPWQLLLEISYPLLDDIQVFVFSADVLQNQYHVGANQPFHQRLIRHEKFLLPLDLAQANTRVLVRVKSDSSMQMPLRLWEKTAFIEHTYFEANVFGFFYGTVLIIAFYHLLVFFSVREPGFLYFFSYALCAVLVVSALRGTSFAFVWPHATAWVDKSIVVGMVGCTLFGSLFSDNVLLVRKIRPRISWWLRAVAVLSVLAAIAALFLPYKLMILVALLIVTLSSIVNPIAHALRVKDGYTPALYIMIGAMIFILSLFVTMFSTLGLVPRNFFTEHISYMGAVVQSLLFSLSLADRMKVDRRLREEAQLKTTTAQQQLLDVQVKINEDLDRMVRERTDELQAANIRLQELSTTDGLTGLRNRRYVDEVLVNECKRAFREKSPLSLLLFDIDHFKKSNDNYGHPFGDLCLVQAAALIRENIRRPPDLAARYGGEEFVVLLPCTDQQGAIRVAQSILHAFGEHRVTEGGRSVSMTVSIGVASCIPGNPSAHETLLKQADELLYRAKQNGRNRVEWNPAAA